MRDEGAKGFTLIELLIVVALIAILSGLAWENYLAASIRAKVSRVAVEHRSLATAIEAYTLDHGTPPRMSHSRYGDPDYDEVNGTPVSGVLSKALSTPTAYIAQVHFLDPFMTRNVGAALDERLYTYQVIGVYVDWNPSSTFWPQALEFYGAWRLASVGPDQTFGHGFANSAQLPYDPTNGLVSFGNIWYAQRQDDSFPRIPDLLGAH